MLDIMWELPPGPERDRASFETPDLRRVDEQLLAGPSFPVYGVAAPSLGGEQLAEAECISAGVTAVGLYCGDLFAADGPMLYVRTVMGDPDDGSVVEPTLPEVVADERDRLYDHAGIDEPEPPDAETGTASLPVADRPTPVEVRQEGQVWAARTSLRHTSADGITTAVTVTVVGRGIALDAVRLHSVDDLAPYLRGRDQARPLERAPAPSDPADWELPPAHGFEAHHAYLEASLAEVEAGHDAMRVGRHYRPRRGWMARQQRLQEAAVRAQMKLATQDRDEAEESVLSLVSHMIHLSEEAHWFADDRLRQGALEESVRYHVFDSDVPSRPAQLAWQQRSTAHVQVELLAAWQRWVDGRA